jgi:flagellar motor switch protein FliM
LEQAWENVADLKLSIERVESNPQLVQIVPPNEVVILVGLELTMGKNRGMLNLCIPFNTIERYAPALTNNSWVGYSTNRATPETRKAVSNRLEGADVELVVTLARSRIRTKDLLSLTEGDIITTEQDVAAALEVAIANVPKFAAQAGAFRGKKAIRIDGVVKP